MKLSLAYYGDPILRRKADKIVDLNDEVRELINNMIDTMHAENGLGLAAPQVHQSLAVFIIQVPIKEGDEILPGKLRVAINPKILQVSQEVWECSEGCLSIPKVSGRVERPFRVTFEATNLEGVLYSEELSGLEARAFLHENDHINGVLYIDRIKGKAKQELEPRLRAIKKMYSTEKKITE
jgi:peptide deformylase